MIHRKTIFLILVSILVLFFAACENGVSFDPSEIIGNGGTNTEIPDGDDDDDDGTEMPIGKGTHSFELDFTHASDFLPENFKFKPLQLNYAGITDTTGNGFEVDFNLTIDVPDVLNSSPVTTPESHQMRLGTSKETPPVVTVPLEDGDQNIKVKIATYEKKEGDFTPTAYFKNDRNLKEFTFTPEKNTVILTVKYENIAALQRGILPIEFTSAKFSDVYKNTMPRELNLSVYSKGNAVTSRVTLDNLVKQHNDGAVTIYKPDDYVLTIENESLESAEAQNYEIPLTMNFLGVQDGSPVTVTAKDNENLDVSNINVQDSVVTFTATHSGSGKFQQVEGTVTLTVDSEHSNLYEGLPLDIVIKTKRDDTFKYYIDDYRDNFTVSKSADNHFDNGHYTAVTIQNILDATSEDEMTYEIFRKDDSSADFKSIGTVTESANKEVIFKDRHAFILRNPEQEYKIKITHSSCTNEDKCTSDAETSPTQKGSRRLTDREVFLAAMDSMRYALIDKNVHRALGTVSAGGGTFKHMRWYLSWQVAYGHGYEINNYKPYFITLGSSVDTNGGRYFQYVADGGNVHTINTQYWTGPNLRYPFKGTVTFTSPFGKGTITFNNVHINNNTWSNPSWASGNISVTVGNKTKIYEKNTGIPFGLYMTSSEFLAKLLDESGNYTQK